MIMIVIMIMIWYDMIWYYMIWYDKIYCIKLYMWYVYIYIYNTSWERLKNYRPYTFSGKPIHFWILYCFRSCPNQKRAKRNSCAILRNSSAMSKSSTINYRSANQNVNFFLVGLPFSAIAVEFSQTYTFQIVCFCFFLPSTFGII